jgi:hypothetical protein
MTKLKTASERFIKCVTFSKYIENLNIIHLVDAVKESILEGCRGEISYIKSKDNIADLLTKYRIESQEFSNIFLYGFYKKMQKE